jgi:uncharacterized protein (DUF1501 family)
MSISRRGFLKGTCGAMTSVSTASALLDLAGFANLAAAQSTNDFKALVCVCVFLNGGNDCHNTSS